MGGAAVARGRDARKVSEARCCGKGSNENWVMANVAVVVARSVGGLLRSATMTEPGASKKTAWRRAVEAARRENEARAERDKANIKDAAIVLRALDKLAEVGDWKKKRLAELRAQADREEAKRVADVRTEAGAALARMRDRGETLATIAERHGVGVGVIRALARHAPNSDKALQRNGSHALGGGGETGGVAYPDTTEPNAASA